MKHDQMPDGYLATRDGDTVRLQLPEVLVTESHVFEPMLTRGAAQQVAEALWNSDVEAPLARVVILRDPRYAEASVEKFRERLWAVLVEGGVEAELEIEVVESAGQAPPAAAPEPPRAATPTPMEAPTGSSGSQERRPEPAPLPKAPPPEKAPEPARKAFVAPVSTKKRLGADRGRREPGTT
jgi:hypothetical protein